MLPRSKDSQGAFVVFIIGLSLAEGCGLLGIFLGGPYRDALFALGLLGVLQFIPVFAGWPFNPDRGASGLRGQG